MSKVTVTKIPLLNTLVIRQFGGQDFFISAKDSIVISIPALSFLLKFLLGSGVVSVKLLEGIIQEHYAGKEEI